MSPEQTKNINKSNISKLIEFFHAIRIVNDLRKLINEGKYYQITPIYGQLRALLTDKTKEKSKEPRPLFDIAKLLGQEIKIFYLPVQKDLPEMPESLLLHIFSLPISIEKVLPLQEEITLEEYLKMDVIRYKDKTFKVHEVIDTLSNKFGGSHYDTKVPQSFMELISFGINNQPLLDNLIIQIADLFIKIGLSLVKKLSDFEFYFTVYVEKFSLEESFLFDYTFPNTNSRISFYSFQGKLWLHLSDLVGKSATFEIEQIVNIKKVLLINITHRITADLKSEIKITIDGINVLQQVISEPLLMINEITNYQRYINRSREKTIQDFEFGFGEIMIFGRNLEDKEKITVYSHFLQRPSDKIVWFNKKSFGTIPPGETDMKMEGPVELKTISK